MADKAGERNELEDLKTQIVGLRIRVKRLEDFLLSFPNAGEYLHESSDLESDILSDEPLFGNAVQIVREYDLASASLLQRRLSIGYARAARLIDMLEKADILGPADGAKPREVLHKKIEEYLKDKDQK